VSLDSAFLKFLLEHGFSVTCDDVKLQLNKGRHEQVQTFLARTACARKIFKITAAVLNGMYCGGKKA
jgi:hypothetical protein